MQRELSGGCGLSILRRVLNLAVREGLIERNPANRLGEIMRRVQRRTASEAGQADSWTPADVDTLLACALVDDRKEGRAASPLRFHTALLFLLCTGARRGEVLGLKWEDVDFESRRVHIRRAIVQRAVTTPKSGRGRFVAMPPGLAERPLRSSRREALAGPWARLARTSRVGVLRRGRRAARRAQFRTLLAARSAASSESRCAPVQAHCTRHTYASLALAAGKSLRWVAEQLGHSNPELTLRTYAHVLRHEETDLSFADFANASSGTARHQTAPARESEPRDDDAPAASQRGRWDSVERETGVEPATLSLGS
jgi:integrase